MEEAESVEYSYEMVVNIVAEMIVNYMENTPKEPEFEYETPVTYQIAAETISSEYPIGMTV